MQSEARGDAETHQPRGSRASEGNLTRVRVHALVHHVCAAVFDSSLMEKKWRVYYRTLEIVLFILHV